MVGSVWGRMAGTILGSGSRFDSCACIDPQAAVRRQPHTPSQPPVHSLFVVMNLQFVANSWSYRHLTTNRIATNISLTRLGGLWLHGPLGPSAPPSCGIPRYRLGFSPNVPAVLGWIGLREEPDRTGCATNLWSVVTHNGTAGATALPDRPRKRPTDAVSGTSETPRRSLPHASSALAASPPPTPPAQPPFQQRRIARARLVVTDQGFVAHPTERHFVLAGVADYRIAFHPLGRPRHGISR